MALLSLMCSKRELVLTPGRKNASAAPREAEDRYRWMEEYLLLLHLQWHFDHGSTKFFSAGEPHLMISCWECPLQSSTIQLNYHFRFAPADKWGDLVYLTFTFKVSFIVWRTKSQNMQSINLCSRIMFNWSFKRFFCLSVLGCCDIWIMQMSPKCREIKQCVYFYPCHDVCTFIMLSKI